MVLIFCTVGVGNPVSEIPVPYRGRLPIGASPGDATGGALRRCFLREMRHSQEEPAMAHVLDERRRWLIATAGALLLATPALAHRRQATHQDQGDRRRHHRDRAADARQRRAAAHPGDLRGRRPAAGRRRGHRARRSSPRRPRRCATSCTAITRSRRRSRSSRASRRPAAWSSWSTSCRPSTRPGQKLTATHPRARAQERHQDRAPGDDRGDAGVERALPPARGARADRRAGRPCARW